MESFVCSAFWHADKIAMAASIKMGLAQNESCVFDDYRVNYNSTAPIVHLTLRCKLQANEFCTSHEAFTCCLTLTQSVRCMAKL